MFIAAVTAMLSAQKAAGTPVQVRLLDTVSGLDSFVPEPTIRLIRDDGAWKKTWADHMYVPMTNGSNDFVAAPAPPTIDFAKTMVLALFDGQAKAGSWRFLGAKPTKDGITLRVQRVPLNSGMLEIAGSPYTFLLLTRSNAKIALEAFDGREARQIADFPKIEPQPVPQRSAGN